MANQLKITLKRSIIGKTEDQRLTVKTLGLRKINQTVLHNDTPQIRGMVKKIEHMLNVEEI